MNADQFGIMLACSLLTASPCAARIDAQRALYFTRFVRTILFRRYAMNPHITRTCVLTAFLLSSPLMHGDTIWDTVYHDDDVTIELRRDYVTYGSDGMPQVQFRWTFSVPQALKFTPGVSYKSRVETTAIDLARRRYRSITATVYDSTGAEIHFDAIVPSHGYEDIKPDSLMEGIFPSAKQLIESKHSE
jgi:hypothetical protein